MAVGATKAIRELGKKVPEDISILGFDGTEIGEYLTPKIATIKRPVESVAKEATNLLIKVIRGEEINRKKIYLESQLVVGDSIKKLF